MIADYIQNAELYYGLGKLFEKGLKYLKTTDIAALEPGKHEIEGDKLFVLIQEYETKPLADCKWESHKKYADIQFIFSGGELMGYAPIEELTDVVDHTPAKDTLNYKDGNGIGGYLKADEGMFFIFFPKDGHIPNIINKTAKNNKKAVVKVLLN